MTDQDVIRFWCDRLGWDWCIFTEQPGIIVGELDGMGYPEQFDYKSIPDLVEAVRVWHSERATVFSKWDELSLTWMNEGPIAFLRAAQEVEK